MSESTDTGDRRLFADAAAPGTTILAAENLSHHFAGGTKEHPFSGLKNISVTFRAGEFVILAGRNGSGKTLLTRHFVGLERPTSGRVLYRGRPVSENINLVRRNIGLVFQDADSQLVGQSVEEELRFGPENLRLPETEIRERARSVMELLGLESRSTVPPASLSGGEKRRLAIGGVLTMEPEILILDEPFANLDYPGVVEVLRILKTQKELGRGIILITHELEKALAHADRLIIMDNGVIAEDGAARLTAPLAGKYGLHPLDFAARAFEEYTWLPP
jgi:biotin transport system ATP-binding protein